MKSINKKYFLMIMLFFLSTISCVAQRPTSAAKEPDFFDKVMQIVWDPLTFMQNNVQVLHLLRAVMHVPYIVTLDSQDPHVIKISALLAALATNAKAGYELFREREQTSLAKLMVTDALKVGGYSLASIYDVVRFLEATNIALQNKQKASIEKARSIKINQVVFLLLEVLLRAVSQVSLRADKTYDHQDNLPARLTAEIADLVEIWRLITRYNAYFALSKVQADLRFVVQRHENTNIPYEIEEDEDAVGVENGVLDMSAAMKNENEEKESEKQEAHFGSLEQIA